MTKPNFYNINIVFEDNERLVVEHNYISKIEINRVVSDAANKFTLSLLDDAAFKVEKKLLMGKNNISVTYYDSNNNAKDTFNGNITKINSSFINDRNMLTIEGYIGLSIKDKYQLISRNWNKVPLFVWEDVFDLETKTDDRDVLEKILDFFIPPVGGGEDILNDCNLINSLIKNGEIYQDDSGKFYTFSHKEEDKDGPPKIVEATEICIPVRPHKILKLIAKGGKLTELLELPYTTNAENLKDDERFEKCTQFIDTLKARDTVSLDYSFIRAWLEQHAEIQGHNWKYNSNNVVKTKLVEADLSQTTMSDVKYIYNVLSKNSVKESKDKKEIVYNFKFSLDSNNTVYFKPVEVSANANPVATYEYYGRNSENNDGINKSYLASFSADTNYLTAFLTGDMSNIEKLSTLNLVTNEPMESNYIQADDTLKAEARYKYKFESKVFAPLKVTSNYAETVNTWKDYWYQAMCQTYRAEATIIGYSKIKPGDYVEIIVVPKPGLYHHTSGLYYVIKQTDTYQNGLFSTQLELIKNVATMGSSTLNKYNK